MFLSSWSSPECSPACHAGDRGFKSHRGRFDLITSFGAVRNSAKRRSSNLRDSAGSIPACATHRVVLLPAVCKAVVTKQARRTTKGSIPSRPTCLGLFVYRSRTPASQAGKAGSIPARVARSPIRAGLWPSGATGRHATLRTSCLRGMGVQISPWSLRSLFRRRRTSVQRSLISSDGRVRLPGLPLVRSSLRFTAEYANFGKAVGSRAR